MIDCFKSEKAWYFLYYKTSDKHSTKLVKVCLKYRFSLFFGLDLIFEWDLNVLNAD